MDAATAEECFRRGEEEYAKADANHLHGVKAAGIWYLAAKKKTKDAGKKWGPELKARCKAKGIASRTAHVAMSVARDWNEVMEFAARCTFPEPNSTRAFLDMLKRMKGGDAGLEQDNDDQAEEGQAGAAEEEEEYDYAGALIKNWDEASKEDREDFIADRMEQLQETLEHVVEWKKKNSESLNRPRLRHAA
jgi:hypothetical protein